MKLSGTAAEFWPGYWRSTSVSHGNTQQQAYSETQNIPFREFLMIKEKESTRTLEVRHKKTRPFTLGYLF